MKIVFVIDPEEGHFLPTLGLADKMQASNHYVLYLAIPDCRTTIEEHGYKCAVIAEDYFPLGYIASARKVQRETGFRPRFNLFQNLKHNLLEKIQQEEPEVIVFSTYLSLEAIVTSYYTHAKIIIFTPYLLSNSTPKHESLNTVMSLLGNPDILESTIVETGFKGKIDTFVSKALDFLEIVACPKEFDFPDSVYSPNSRHLGPFIRQIKSNNEFLKTIQKDKRIIYASMGSQTDRIFDQCRLLFSTLIDLMRSNVMSHFHLVIVSAEAEYFGNKLPDNVTIVPWAQQIGVLQVSTIMINHGGLGTIKECIYFGVPMIVFPDRYDQPTNAERVVFHGLGVRSDINNISVETLTLSILEVANDTIIRSNVKKMQSLFQSRERDAVHYF